jgi:MFS family permease
VASLIGGYLGKISWQAAFWGYAFVLICALLIFVFVPEPTRIQKESDAEAGIVREEAKKEKQSMAGVPAIAWLYCAVMFLEFMCITIMYSVISSRLVAIGYTSVQAGVAISMTGYAMAVVSLIFGFVTRYVKRWGVVIAIALAAVSYFVLGYSGNLGMIYVACAVIGAAMGFSNPTIFNYVNIDCSGNIPMSNSIVLAGLTLGGFVSSFLLQAFVGMYGKNYSAMFNATGFLLVIILAFTTFVVIYANKRAQRLGQASTN